MLTVLGFKCTLRHPLPYFAPFPVAEQGKETVEVFPDGLRNRIVTHRRIFRTGGGAEGRTPARLTAYTTRIIAFSLQLNLFDITMIVMGGIIGSGIFMNPHVVAEQVPIEQFIIGVWIFGGSVAMAGALVYADLA